MAVFGGPHPHRGLCRRLAAVRQLRAADCGASMVDKVYLVRHGRTALNAAGLLRGRLDEPLDEVGRGEAAALADVFAGVPLREIVSSPLARSLDTARCIAERQGAKVHTLHDLIDRDYGPWSGKTLESVERRYGSIDRAPAEEVEDKEAFRRRLVEALSSVMRRNGGGNVMIVAHDAVNRALIRHYRPDLAEIPQPTGCWNLLEFDGASPTCRVIGALPGDGQTP